ncbi:aminotransferase class I/II-fold pyridoxal phosphate-dependent enzyme [Dermacoccus nishinomiyaensis]|uniref:aminotransferase class I/II-fold pyridoxal phosphate-dependent enzyme n=1 Tax=Dermacoccus nishinomiyaensis TaxID=1274 RepID=UPI00093A5B7B|nr:aminotransferase class I/II-fold pyridoxal phosphate-dependent enzyme [Dermacoccus nishinomiyaensis]HCQ19214.1 aminotransferase class V-fold PLP-dependent enzyme [Dermacoccus sp.]
MSDSTTPAPQTSPAPRAGRRSAIRPAGGQTIFSRMTALAAETGALNLGQGFPDADGPEAVLAAARQAIADGANQYPPARGERTLLEAIAAHQHHWYGLEVSPDTDVLVTVGATEALASAILAFVELGDEVVVFEPTYDSYAADIARAGGVRRTVPLRFPDFALDEDALAAAFSERTALVLLNTPHNPTGKVFTAAECATIAEHAARHDAVVISDEVYEHLAIAPHEHMPFASTPGMPERTLTISSGGKTFSTTGWKIGWVSGPADLVAAVASVKQFLTFASGTPLQHGIAAGLCLPDAFFAEQRAEMAARSALLVDGLTRAGFDAVAPQGGYFVLADAAPLGVDDAAEFALRLPTEAGVVAIPASAFCDDPDASGMTSVLRFAFCKQRSVIDAAIERLVDTYGRSARTT